MSRTPKKPPLALDMDFSEALTRFAQTDPNELPDKFTLKKKGADTAPFKSRLKPD